MKGLAFAAVICASAITPLQAQTAAADFSFSGVTPGAWIYRSVTGGTEAAFLDGAGATRMVIACGKVTRLVTLSRVSTAPATTMSFWTSSVTRDLTSRFHQPSGRVIAQVGGLDPLLDAIVFSRGHFAISMPGYPALVLPAGTEIAHVVEDCRA